MFLGIMSGRVSSRRTNTARPKSAMSEILSHAGGAEGEVKMINGGKVPSLGNLRDRLPTQRSVSFHTTATLHGQSGR